MAGFLNRLQGLLERSRTVDCLGPLALPESELMMPWQWRTAGSW